MQLREMVAPLGGRDFRFLFAGSVVSIAGTAIAPIALAFAVLDLTGSATDLGVVLAAAWVPQIVFVLAGGVWSDRLPRHVVMVASNVVSGAAQLAVAALLLTDAAELWHLVALQVVRGIATSFFFPASQGVVPQVVPASMLQRANALIRLSYSGTNILGASIGGILVAAFGSGEAIAFDGLTYLASAALVARVKISRRERVDAPNFLRELRDGWNEFRSRTWLWVIVVEAMVANAAFSGTFNVLGPLVADRALGGPAAWGAILAAQSAGLIAGGVLILQVRPQRPMLVGMGALLPWASPLALLALEAPAYAVAAAAFVAGMGLEVFSVLWSTALQEHVPLDKLSRVSSYDALGSFVFIPLGLSVAGPVAEELGVGRTLWVAFAIALGCVVVTLAVPDVRNLRRRDQAPAQPAAATP